MLVLYYFNWVGTPEEFKEYGKRVKNICDGIKGVDLKGVFAPSSEWSAVALLEAVSFEKALEVYRAYIKKYGIRRSNMRCVSPPNLVTAIFKHS